MEPYKFSPLWRLRFLSVTREILGNLGVASLFSSVTQILIRNLLLSRPNAPVAAADDAILEMQYSGTQIRPVYGSLVQPDEGLLWKPRTGSITDKAAKSTPGVLPKTRQLLDSLLSNGITPTDLVIYYGGVGRKMVRRTPYSIIEIPSLQRQIAICDQFGQVTFVSRRILPVTVWTEEKKSQLRVRTDTISEIHYDAQGEWLSEIVKIVFGGDAAISHTPQRFKAGISNKPPLTEKQIIRWIKLYKEKTGVMPTVGGKSRYKPLWDKNAAGKWIQLDENWDAIDQALSKGNRGLPGGTTLHKFIETHGLDNITVDQIKKWILLFHEKENRWPANDDEIVWDKNRRGRWIQVKSETWSRLAKNLMRGQRGLPEGLSIAKIKEQMDLPKEWSREKIIEWISIFLVVKGRWPKQQDPHIFEPDEKDGYIIVKGKKWAAVNRALIEGRPGMPGGSSLILLKEELVANPDLFPAEVRPAHILPLPPRSGGRLRRDASKELSAA